MESGKADKKRNLLGIFIPAAAMIIVAIIGYFATIHQKGEESAPAPIPTGKIISPKENDLVSPQGIEVTFDLENIHHDHSVWLVVQMGNQFWPKSDEIRGDQKGKTVQIFEDGEPGKSFWINLMMVDDEGTKFIRSWYSKGVETRDYSALEQIPGHSILDNVKVMLR